MSKRLVPLLILLLLAGPPVCAQDSGRLSSSVVLVLKLVSADRVRPVTGVVVSADGLVLVPADFTAEPAEIVVLDGGTDIIGHGRPATVVYRALPGGLAILSVQGLDRPAVTFSAAGADADTRLHFQAFPPAQSIASGAEPLFQSITAGTPLPYVTGAVMDDCGYLAGISIARGAQSLETEQQPQRVAISELQQALASINVELKEASCPRQPLLADDNNKPAPEAMHEEPVSNAEPELETEPVEPTPSDAAVPVKSGPANPAPATTVERPSLWRSVPTWLYVAITVVIAVLVWKLAFLLYPAREPDRISSGSRPQPASDEPATLQLQSTADPSIPGPRSGYIDEALPPDMNDLPDGCNGVVLLEGRLDADTTFRRFCSVKLECFDILIGRADADLCIEHSAISRHHARLECTDTVMTLSDLGSSNGTFINGIPCLPREIMFVTPADEIYLGDVQLVVRLLGQEAGLT